MRSKIITLIITVILSSLLNQGCSISQDLGITKESVEVISKAPTPKPDKEQLVFRLADYWPADYPPVLGDKEFARLVEERSRGKIKIIVYSDAVLGDEKPVIEQVQLGGIDFARVNSAPLVNVSSKLGVLSLPYLFRDSEHLWNVLLGQIGDELLNSMKDGGITGLAYYDSGARSFYTKKPVSKISDLEGMKIRVQQSDTFASYIKLLGAKPLLMNFGDVYDALQKDDADGAENNWSSYYESSHFKVAKYYLLDEHTRNPEILFASSKVMDSLSDEYKQIIISSAKDSVKLQRKAWNEAEAKSEDNIRKSGAVITKITENERLLLEKAASPLYDDYGKEYKSLIERIRNTK